MFEDGRQFSYTGRQQNLCQKLPNTDSTSGVCDRDMMSNGVRRNLGDPTGFSSLMGYWRTIEKKGVDTTRWKSDQFVVEE